MKIPRFTMGVGDRFAHQGKAQLAAFVKAKELGADVYPVWNKSNREHITIGSLPPSLRAEADEAVKALNWKGPYFVDADHINLGTVDGFIDSSDFFTLDVAEYIGKAAPEAEIKAFVNKYHSYTTKKLEIPGIDKPFDVTTAHIEKIARKFLGAAIEAGKIYQHVAAKKGVGKFVTEVSMDETDEPQTPLDLLFILAALSDQKIPVQTIAPKFTGRFNKGCDFVGDVSGFELEFAQDLNVITFAIREFGLSDDLKISVHSGSDKFSIYGPIRRSLRKYNGGLHLKTAGTTWLEEVIGLASAGGKGLEIAKDVYTQALDHLQELSAPYATVIDIKAADLPSAAVVKGWTSEQFNAALIHDPKNPAFNQSIRQLIHVGYKIAAKMGPRFLDALDEFEPEIAKHVTQNIFERHLKRIFLERD